MRFLERGPQGFPAAICRWATLAVMAMVLCACDATYGFIVENCSDQPVTVTLRYKSGWDLAPCTGRVRLRDLGPPQRNDWDVQVKDSSGNVLAEESIPVSRDHGAAGTDRYIYRYAGVPDACPVPVEGYYRIVIVNQSESTKDVAIDGWYPGSMRPGDEVQIFHAGNILDVRALHLQSLDGTRLSAEGDRQYAYGLQVPDYHIGDAPAVIITLY